MRDEGVIYVAGHPLLNRRCTRLPGCIRLRNDLYCVGWGVKLYSLTVKVRWVTEYRSVPDEYVSNLLQYNFVTICVLITDNFRTLYPKVSLILECGSALTEVCYEYF